MKVYFVTHPEVEIDPAVPVPEWTLLATGLKRMDAFCRRPELAGVTDVFASPEPKALDCAEAFEAAWKRSFHTDPGLAENDRSSTRWTSCAWVPSAKVRGLEGKSSGGHWP